MLKLKKFGVLSATVGLLAFGAVAAGGVLPSRAPRPGTLSNANGGGCLTAPASGTIDFTALQVASCKGAVGQKWTVPAATAS